MKIGLLADVRGNRPLLEVALAILDEAGCDRIASLGATVEGGDDDAAVLEALRARDAVFLPAPHDADQSLLALPGETELAGLTLTHATPDELPLMQTFWATGYGVPDILQVAEHLGRSPQQRACGDWYEAMVMAVPEGGASFRRIFLRSGSTRVPAGSFLACPGSVAMAAQWRRGGSVMTWDDASREACVVRFGPDGAIDDPRLRVLVYCEEFDPHLPEDDVLAHVDVTVLDTADGIASDVERLDPDFVLLDYHLAGRSSGLDALLELRPGGAELPVPVFTIASNPADQGSMKEAGAYGSLPFTYLKDTFTRLLREVGGAG